MTLVKFLLWWVLGWFFLLPLLTFIHEAGHGLMGLLLTKQPVTIQLGKLPAHIQFHWGRVMLSIRVPVNFTGFAGVDDFTLMSRKTKVLFVFGGPLASLAILSASVWQSILFGRSSLSWFQPFWNILAAGSLFQLIFTLAPMEYPAWMADYAGLKSDGFKIRELLFQKIAASKELTLNDE